MAESRVNKLKIFNDPVYGFINIPDESIFDLIENPFFQRLRYIRQLGMTHLVYPGALHTRFHHAMGAMYLTFQAMDILRFKGHDISQQEYLATLQAILLHDIGHGPFSHALENTLVPAMNHESLGLLFMKALNERYHGRLEEAIRIYTGDHQKAFLHQLVSSQLDMDRLDYLNRDSFFTGVSEGVISWDRIIKMLNVASGQLVIDEKGIYSIEKFLIARRLMYWQVYLHKTVLAAECMLVNILKRAKQLAVSGDALFAGPSLRRFLYHDFSAVDFASDPSLIADFARLDDNDIIYSIKMWSDHPDFVLKTLCGQLLNRHLLRIVVSREPFEAGTTEEMIKKTSNLFRISPEDASFFVISGITRNSAYDPGVDNILIMDKRGGLTDIAQASDQLNIRVLSGAVEKFYLCFPKELGAALVK